MTHRTSRRIAAACLGVVALLAAAPGAHGGPPPPSERPPVSVTLEPVAHGGTATVMTRVAPATANPQAPERWILNPMWSITNNSGQSLLLRRTSLTLGDYIGTCDSEAPCGSSEEPGAPLVIPAGEKVLVLAAPKGGTPHGFQGDLLEGDIPPSVATSNLEFEGYDEPLRMSSSLKVHRHETPSGAYHFPLRATDLPPGAYWTTNNNGQDSMNNHYSTSQAYAYDIVAQRYQSATEVWTVNKADPDPTKPEFESYLAYDMPVYAMDAGTVLECRSDRPDLDDNSESGTKDSNRLWIKHGEGEYALYAHLRQNSVPNDVCAPGATVHAGQQIAAIGNNGVSSQPHLHVHLSRSAPDNVNSEGQTVLPINDDGGPGLPLMFDRFETAQFSSTPPPRLTFVNPTEFSLVPDDTARAIPKAGIVKPYPCGWATPDPADHEATQFNVGAGCVEEISEDLVENGQQPVAIDGMTVAGATSYNLINRSGRPQTRVGLKLTRKQLQQRIDQLAGTRFRPIHIDNYVRDGVLWFAAVWARLGGPARSTYYGVTQAEHDAKLAELRNDGYQPLVVSATTGPGGRRFSAIYEQRAVSNLFTGVTPVSGMQAKADELTANGLGPVHFDGFDSGGTAHISHTWHGAASESWVALAGLDQSTLEEKTAERFEQGWFTTSATGYDAGGDARFAAIWRASP